MNSHIDKGMRLAIEKAEETMNKDLGGPFGASVISKSGEVISVSSNSVLGDHDPTAHAEINAIRKACQVLKTHDLTDYILVTTSYPCPMCLGAIMWSNIKEVIYGCRLDDAKGIGFRDDLMYDFIKMDMKNKDILVLEEVQRNSCLKLFKSYHEQNKTLY
jgi:guanine deaminase